MNVLGINFSIDAAAALVVDGLPVAAAAQERFSRIKHDSSFPSQAVQFCLNYANMSFQDLDALAFFWNPGRHIEPALRKLSSVFRHHAEYLYSVPNHIIQLMGQPAIKRLTLTLELEHGKVLPIHFLDHHLCHAAATFFNSRFEEAAILTVDGYGERTSTLIAKGIGTRIEPIITVEFPHSLGAFYAAFTQYLGFRPNNGEGKVMGLASWGTDSLYCKIRPLVRLTPAGFELDLSYFSYNMETKRRYTSKLTELLGPERKPGTQIDSRHKDIAYAVQRVLEEAMVHLANIAYAQTKFPHLCIAGGVGLNCVANRRILLDTPFENLFILPPSGDAGSSMGAAQYVSIVQNSAPRPDKEYSDYLGLENSQQEIRQAIDSCGLQPTILKDPARAAAELISQGAIVGWFQGRAEFGPRALGNRSILADPRKAEMKDILNSRVKFREPFRPFAPSCLEEACGELFDIDLPSPYMLQVYNTRPEKLHQLEAITHVDGGARVQTVNRRQNPLYYALISEFGRLTGVPCILNTSFNVRGEPIVNTIKHALACFFATDMDALIAGKCCLTKPGSRFDEIIKSWSA